MLSNSVVARYQSVEWDRLLRGDLGNAGQLSEAKPVFDRIKSIFDRILTSPITATLAVPAKQEIENQLNYFLDFLDNDISKFSDVSQKSQKVEAIKTTEWNILNSLGKFLSYYPLGDQKIDIGATIKQEILPLKTQFEAEIAELKDAKKDLPILVDKIKSSLGVANNLDQNSALIEKAIQRAKEFVRQNEEAVQLILKNNATDASRKALEHATLHTEWVGIWFFKRIPHLKKIKQPSWSGSLPWLLLSFFWGIVVFSITIFFLVISDGTFSIGAAILRVSTLLVPAYFTVFCAQQYTNHRRLYEAYKFKDISLQTMIGLRERLPERSHEREHVLDKSLDVLFSEPSLKEDGKYDKQLIVEILRLVGKA